VRFEWDPRKAEDNLRKHRVDFEAAKSVFEDPLAVSIPDVEHSENEERWITLGRARGRDPILVVCHAYRDRGDEEIIRIISARKGTAKERRQYTQLPGFKP
jgi:uncharacterized DUF497 family protein